MPIVTVKLEEGDKRFEVASGIRLVLALEDNGVDVSHRCGGNAQCTTCRCKITQGEPSKMTQAEKERLQHAKEKGDQEILGGARLSCQVLVEHDMTVEPLRRVKDMDWDTPGSRPEDYITPEAVWTEK